MGGYFGVASKTSCTMDLFFGTDYHSHLGTKSGGMAVYGDNGFQRIIHNIANTPFRTKFDRDLDELEGYVGIGCISDSDPQPLLIRSHLGEYALTTVGTINNKQQLIDELYANGHVHFMGMSGGKINSTELIATIIDQCNSFVEGLQLVQEKVIGSMSCLLLTKDGIYACRDRYGRTPITIGKKEDAFCISFENFAYLNLGYHHYSELGPGEIDFVTYDNVKVVSPAKEEMKMCSFLWVYYGYPNASYEGVSVEKMRYDCGRLLARHDNNDGIRVDSVAGVPDSGLAHAIGYANESGIEYTRPFVKYTPTWPRSFMPSNQKQRNLIAKMKLIPVHSLIQDKSLLLIDDSIVRGTQLGETTQFLYDSGATEVHIRTACPPIMYACPYLAFSRSTSDYDLITRRIIRDREGENISDELLADYANPDSQNYQEMVEEIRKRLNFTTLRFHRLDDMLESIGIPPHKLCTYCWNGKG
ncbi:MAG: amidophosphoribosyltransferase [Lachnospiraceae bacterium]|nr:amidophosphoribosyltransferase [Lachnospiraceae bacterium]MBR0306806.1 amidophosphoribosyltransferase [Lachnospiraceae bacterium]